MKTFIKIITTLAFIPAMFTMTSCDKAGDMAAGAANMAGAGDTIKNLTGAFGGITDSLGAVKDTASAEAAVPQLEEAGGKLDALTSGLDKLPAPVRETIKSKVGAFQPQLTEAVDKVSKIEGVGPVIKPAIDGIMAKLTALTGS